MKNSNPSPFLPTSNDPRANKLLIFDCLNLFGEEVGTFVEERMTEISGINWLQDLRRLRDQHRVNVKDADWVIKEALKSDSPLRQIFPRNPKDYGTCLQGFADCWFVHGGKLQRNIHCIQLVRLVRQH